MLQLLYRVHYELNHRPSVDVCRESMPFMQRFESIGDKSSGNGMQSALSLVSG